VSGRVLKESFCRLGQGSSAAMRSPVFRTLTHDRGGLPSAFLQPGYRPFDCSLAARIETLRYINEHVSHPLYVHAR
jgi:hypothetical protein